MYSIDEYVCILFIYFIQYTRIYNFIYMERVSQNLICFHFYPCALSFCLWPSFVVILWRSMTSFKASFFMNNRNSKKIRSLHPFVSHVFYSDRFYLPTNTTNSSWCVFVRFFFFVILFFVSWYCFFHLLHSVFIVFVFLLTLLMCPILPSHGSTLESIFSKIFLLNLHCVLYAYLLLFDLDESCSY